MPLPRTIGTRDGTDPPTSTLNAEPRSVAQIHNIGWRPVSAGHHTAAPAPTRAGASALKVTRAATSVPAPATVPARAPARAAPRAAADSLAQIANCTAPRTSSSTIGQANANSISAVPRAESFIVGFAAAP